MRGLLGCSVSVRVVRIAIVVGLVTWDFQGEAEERWILAEKTSL